MNKKQLKSFLHGSAVSMVGVGTLGIMNYFIRRTLSLNLPETDFGFFYSAFALVSIVMVFIDLGLSQAATIMLAKSIAANDQLTSNKIFTINFWVKIGLALFAFIVLSLLAPYLTTNYFKYSGSYITLIIIFSLILTQTAESVFSPIVKAKKKFFTQQVLINLKIGLILIGILFGITTYGFQYTVWCFIFPSAIIAILGFKIVRLYDFKLLSPITVKKHDIKKLFAISSWIAISSAGISMMYFMDTICLTWLSDLKSVAMYNIALPIMQIAQSFFVFPAIFTPHVAEMWQQQNYSGIRKSCLRGNLLMLSTLPVFILVGSYFAPTIITVLFAPKFTAAAHAVTILWSGMVFFSIASFNINALNSGGWQKNVTYMIIGCVIINFTLNVILIPKFGYTGAALATAITYLLMAVASIVSLNFIFKLKN